MLFAKEKSVYTRGNYHLVKICDSYMVCKDNVVIIQLFCISLDGAKTRLDEIKEN